MAWMGKTEPPKGKLGFASCFRVARPQVRASVRPNNSKVRLVN